MDSTRRQITKIAREVSKFTVRMLKTDGVGTAEYDFIHAVRKNPGITQAALRELLTLDKGAAARRAASLETKGYLIRKPNPEDGRSQLLYATEKADSLKSSKASVEALYYEWLEEALTPEDNEEFCRILNMLYARSKAESKAGFPNLTRRFLEGTGKNEPSAD
ncbi:Transcriptional regulator, MarR family [Ruminococcaceae bacterium BL-6]|nr:Transcriptional regulator, MarR family [Ruminococcaceae bacterium BL-6]